MKNLLPFFLLFSNGKGKIDYSNSSTYFWIGANLEYILDPPEWEANFTYKGRIIEITKWYKGCTVCILKKVTSGV